MKPETLDKIKQDIESGALTNPVIVYERTLKAVSEIWPTDEQIEYKNAFGGVGHTCLDTTKWLRRWLSRWYFG